MTFCPDTVLVRGRSFQRVACTGSWHFLAGADGPARVCRSRARARDRTLPLAQIYCGYYTIATMQYDEAVALADQKGALFWKGAANNVSGVYIGFGR